MSEDIIQTELALERAEEESAKWKTLAGELAKSLRLTHIHFAPDKTCTHCDLIAKAREARL